MIARRYFILISFSFLACSQPKSGEERETKESTQTQPGAWQTDQYLDLIKGKKVGLCVNHTSTIGNTHLVDSLLSLGINIPKIFAPEHGFRGEADAGEHVKSEVTENYELISLFGAKREPSDEDVSGLDVIIFDIQDVGVRFYTYISTMHYLMEAALRNGIPFIVLDRPNPNGSYVDGPFLKESQRSFVGLHPIPIVHGLTVGELAKMIVGEGWLYPPDSPKGGQRTPDSPKGGRTSPDSPKGGLLDLTVIPVRNWDHSMPYSLPIKPSPNLPNDLSIALYPSTCLFEGTIVSVGRGTSTPFQHIGHPDYPDQTYSFTPKPMDGAKEPKLNGQVCYGLDFTKEEIVYQFEVSSVIDFYNKMGQPEDFFTSYFKLLAGDLDEQIKAGMSAQEIRASWQEELEGYKKMRKGYLMYD